MLPETIPVRYTEEEAGYVTVRPVVKQTFRQDELIDMVLRVTGKDPERIRQILRSGTVVYNFYRYWWAGFDAPPEQLSAALAKFPGDDPARLFHPEECDAVLMEYGGGTQHKSVEFSREHLSKKRFLRAKSLWDSFLSLAQSGSLEYQGYSYARRADLYRHALVPSELAALLSDAAKLAPRPVRNELRHLPQINYVSYSCPRT